MVGAVNNTTIQYITLIIILLISGPILAKDIVSVKKVHPPKCLLLKETNALLCPRIMEVDVTISGNKEKHLVRCALFSEEEEVLASGEAFIYKPAGKLYLTLRTRTRIHGLTLIAGAKCSSDPY